MATRRRRPLDETGGVLMKGRLNQYTCNDCGGTITTVDVDEGVTPMFLGCQVAPTCLGRMASHMYQVQGTPEPTHEWFRPSLKNARRQGPDMFDHVKRGGLDIRSVST